MFNCSTCGKSNQSGVHFCSWCGTLLRGTATGLLAARSHLHNGRYMILEVVGKGGMGAVYKALDTQLNGRVVAVKEMSQSGLVGQDLREAIASFTREAEMLTQLKHASLPHIYEQFEDNGRRYLVMEFIEGKTLEARLENYRKRNDLLPLSQAIEICRQLCTVLEYLHMQQPPIIFRDLKPANIMLDTQGRVYLIDFGIARLFKPGQTRDTVALGSSGYAPPEQYRKATSPRSDIYSLGATLHQMLTGNDPSQNPFLFKPFSIHNPPLEQLVMNMVALDQDQRPASMRAVRGVLDGLVIGSQLQRKLPVQPKQQHASRSISVQPRHQAKRAHTAVRAPLIVSVVVSSADEDRQLWQRIQQQLLALIDGFPDIEIRVGGQRLDEAGLILLPVSDAFLSTSECMEAADRAIDQHETRGITIVLINLSTCVLSGTRLEHLRIVPEDVVAQRSPYAQAQRVLEVIRTVRSLLIPLILGGKTGGRMNLLQWLLWQLYGDGLRACRYFLVGDYALKHIHPSGLAGILLHLYDLRRARVVAEYLIGPLRCPDLTRLMEMVAPQSIDPVAVQGVAMRRQPR